jgi:hypothetical protein
MNLSLGITDRLALLAACAACVFMTVALAL